MKTSIFLIIVGFILLIISFMLRSEQITQRKKIAGNQEEYQLLGAAAGGAGGAAVGASIGGVGLALCGTGIGIPAGLVVLGLGALGAVCGSEIGKAAGTPDRYEIVTSPAFSPWIWGSLMLIALALIAFGSISLWRQYNKSNKAVS